MQNPSNMETQKYIKSKTGLGQFNYQKQLLETHRAEAKKYLWQQGYNHKETNYIMEFYDKRVNKDNIIQIHTHNMTVFFNKLVIDDLDYLIKNSTTKNYK